MKRQNEDQSGPYIYEKPLKVHSKQAKRSKALAANVVSVGAVLLASQILVPSQAQTISQASETQGDQTLQANEQSSVAETSIDSTQAPEAKAIKVQTASNKKIQVNSPSIKTLTTVPSAEANTSAPTSAASAPQGSTGGNTSSATGSSAGSSSGSGSSSSSGNTSSATGSSSGTSSNSGSSSSSGNTSSATGSSSGEDYEDDDDRDDDDDDDDDRDDD